MQINQTLIEDSFAEAFDMKFARLIVTAEDEHWLWAAIHELTGYGSSVIACDAEIGLEQLLEGDATPDGRPGASVLVFGFSSKALGASVANRVGQCVMTCPSTALFDGLPDTEKRLPVGKLIRFFGDGFQKSKQVGETRYWRIPVMDGEFLVGEDVGCQGGIAGGNIILQTNHQPQALRAARAAVESIAGAPGVITPFPGGVARSGSKVGSRYKKLTASTADQYCPTLRGRVESKLHPDANCALEIVFDAVDEASMRTAMSRAIRSAAEHDVLNIGAGNYGGQLGRHHFHLHALFD